MCLENSVGKLTTFYELIDREQKDSFDKILIPKIQRDYAQGRPNRKKLRGRFLNCLFSAIDEPVAEKCELDFIYGQKFTTRKESIFLPVDGQQRLTTLFLLHLYIAKRAGIKDEKKLGDLRKFSYETRDSSKQFCERLHEIPEKNFNGIKAYIEKQWWYNARWKNDPTISSMIVMLDDIDNHYKKSMEWNFCEIWDRLKVNIKFWLLTLDDLKTTDDIYIKMNSRGKLLTNFEHFKAQLLRYISDDDYRKHFSRKIDTTWTDLLWDYRDKKNDNDPEKYMDNGLDKKFMNIITLYMFVERSKECQEYVSLDQSSSFEALNPLDLAQEVFQNNPELIARFERIMDFFCQKKNVGLFYNKIFCTTAYEEDMVPPQTPLDYRVYIPKNELRGSVDYLQAVANGGGMPARKVLMLEAFFEAASQRKDDGTVIDDADIIEKVRVIRNLIFNSDLRSERMPTLLNRVDKIMTNVHDIGPDAEKGFNIDQSKQEKIKQDWIKNNPNEELIIKNVENHSLTVGNLSIYVEDQLCLINEIKLHRELFHKDANYDLIERLLLTFGDFSYTYDGRKQYGGKFEYLWRNIIFAYTNKAMTNVLRNLLLCPSLTNYNDESIRQYIDDWLKQKETASDYTWEYYLAKYDGMRRGDEGRYLIKEGKYDYIMLNKSQLNGKHWYPFLYCINTLFDNKFILGEYGAPLYIPGYKVESHESSYTFEPDNGGKVIEIQIPQNNDGIDKVDRILLMRDKIKQRLSQDSNKTFMDEPSTSS